MKSFVYVLCVFSFLRIDYLEGKVPLVGNHKTFAGAIEFPAHVGMVPKFVLFYNGELCEVDTDGVNQGISNQGYFEITDVPDMHKVYVLITPDLKKPKENNFRYFERDVRLPYRMFMLSWYSFTRSAKQDSTSVTLEVRPEVYESFKISELEVAPEIIPDNTIIIYMDPVLVDRLESESWQASDTVAKLPRIILDGLLTQKKLEKCIVSMRCSQLNALPFHRRRDKKVVQVGNTHLISIPYYNIQHTI